MRFAIMECSDLGVDFIRIDGMIANFSYMDARKVMKKLTEVNGNLYSAIAIENDFYEPTMACSSEVI